MKEPASTDTADTPSRLGDSEDEDYESEEEALDELD